MLSADELHRRGVQAINAGRVRSARRPLRAALDRTDDVALLGAIEASLAYVEAETGDRDAALALCERAAGRPGLNRTMRGIIESQRALLIMLAGRTAEALTVYDEAVPELGDAPLYLGRALDNRGNLYLHQEDHARAAADFAAAVEHLRGTAPESEVAMAEHNLGYARFMAGDLPRALHDMDRARAVLAALSPVAEATCDQDRAEVLMAAGLVAEARDALAAAAAAYGAGRLRRRQAEAELALARNLLFEDPRVAHASARAAARRFRAAGAHAWAARADGLALACAVELGRGGADLLEQADRLVADLRALGLRWAAATVSLHAARAEIRAAATAEARARVRTVRVGAAAPLGVRLLDRLVRAELAEADGRARAALRHLRSGLADLHTWQSSFGSLDLQTGVVGQGTRLGVLGLTLAVESGRADTLLEWSERARMLASRVQPVRAPEDPDLVADLAELREIARAREEARRTSLDREAELRQRVREHAWRHRGSGAVTDPVTLGGLQDALGDDTAVVAYVVTADRLVALVVTSGSAARVDLGERARLDALLSGLLPDLDVAASDLPDPMAGFVRGHLATRLDRLAAVLVAPVLEAVGDRRVVLTPSGVLAGVPWTLLDGLVGRPVTVAQSATAWLARRTAPLRLGTVGFVAGPRVARAEDEVTAAAKEWPSARLLVGAAADAASVSALAAGVDVLHVAAHGRHSAENPMFSGLALGDGPWFGYDIDQLRAVPDVVLLSACEVGRSTVRWGEELIGMAGAWLHAGARCVVASSAAVNDRAAYDVLVAVHQQLAAGVDPAAALAAAVPAASAGTAPVPLVCFG